jgi:Mg-chelatase subunit ChlD
MGTVKHAVLTLAVLFITGPGCQGYGSGELNESGQALVQPVRILFAVDCSQSMAVSDPAPAGRVRAAEEIIWGLLPDPDTEFGLMRFSGQATWLTGIHRNDWVFTSNREVLTQALKALGESSGNTNYEAALDLIHQALWPRMIEDEILLPGRARYHVIFLTDGLPSPTDQDGDFNTESRIREMVSKIAALTDDYNVASLKMHFAYLTAGSPASAQISAFSLLRDLAHIGRGEYLEFQSGADIDFTSIDLR